jgi:hypothetical protein
LQQVDGLVPGTNKFAAIGKSPQADALADNERLKGDVPSAMGRIPHH